MKHSILSFLFFISFLNLLGCKRDKVTPNSPNLSISPKPPSLVVDSSLLFLNMDINEANAIDYGNDLIKNQVTVSNLEGEVYAHDSKLVILNGKGYCAYYANEKDTREGTQGQSIHLSVFDIKKPSDKKVFDVFKENALYNSLKMDKNQPIYTPVLFITDDNKIRVLGRVIVKNVEKFYYRDFSPEAETFTDPQICKIFSIASNKMEDFDINVVRSNLKSLFGSDFKLSTDFMFAASDPVLSENGAFLGITVGRFTMNWKTDEGVTLILKTNDFGKTFEVFNAPESRQINSKLNQQFVEGAFDFFEGDKLIMIGRNSIGGILKCESNDGGKSFSIPVSLNENCKFNTLATKPQLFNIGGGILSIWNTTENFGGNNFRTVLEIRYGKDSEICSNQKKIIIKNAFGCHYPSLFEYENNFYMVYSTDSRRLNRNSTGEIVFVKLPF